MKPPFRITPATLALCGDIQRLVGRCEGLSGARPQPELRRQNRIRTVLGSVAIEGNTLSHDQVAAVLDGKRVLGPAREILEVRNAIAAYDAAARYRASSERDLLRAHAVMMDGLVPDAGRWRSRDVGVMRGARVAHVAPQSTRVAPLMRQLLSFVARDRSAPLLVKACVFHCELEFIHPFQDGNGRMGRLWQHVILLADSPTFGFIPTESVIKGRQRDYYRVLAACDQAGDSTAFVEFSLAALREALAAFADELRPSRSDAGERLDAARAQFGRRFFTRKEYLALHQVIATATASRDLRQGVDATLLRREGRKATARYRFGRGR